MPSTPFGEHLKRERELRGVTLEEIAAATRISPRFLEALENEQWDRLPGGAFNRGFIRSVARFLGLDEESMVAEYALETKGLNQSAATPDPMALGMPRDYRPAIFAGVAVIVLIIAVALAIHFYRARSRARSQQQSTPALQVAPATDPATTRSPTGGAH
jgi:cytoskeleton protein RodZ